MLLFVSGQTLNSYSYHHKTFIVDEQLLWNHAIKFFRWQHPAAGNGQRLWFAVPDAICLMSFLFTFLQ